MMGVEWLWPAALGGLGLLAVPIAVHLFARTPVVRVVVPSLRLIAPRVARRRRRRHLRDPWLLALRLFIVAAAVIASAGPLVTTPAREALWARRTARAVVVDRGLPESALGAVGALIAAESSSATVAETFGAAPVDGRVPLALAWLARQGPAQREIVFVGDDASLPGPEAVAAIPAGTGIRVRTVDNPVPPEPRLWIGGDRDGRLRGRRLVTTLVGDQVAGTAADEAPPRLPVIVRSSAGDRRLLDAVWEGVAAEGSFLRPVATWLGLEIVWTTALAQPDAATTALTRADRAALWPLAGRLAGGEPSRVDTPPWTNLAPEVAAARRGDTIVVRVTRPAEPVHAAAVLRAALLVAAGDADLPRRARLAGTDVRTAIERPAAGVSPEATRFETARDGRWFWAVAVGLLLAEQWVRRRRDTARQAAGADTTSEAMS
jgi:hypothetical protein